MRPPDQIKAGVTRMIKRFGVPTIISFNLGHGILPNIPYTTPEHSFDAVKEIPGLMQAMKEQFIHLIHDLPNRILCLSWRG